MKEEARQVWHLLAGSPSYVLCGREPHQAIRFDGTGLIDTIRLVKWFGGYTCTACALRAKELS